jgi:hypothetical protein
MQDNGKISSRFNEDNFLWDKTPWISFVVYLVALLVFFFFEIPIYLQSVEVHWANEVMDRRVEECSAALLHIEQVQCPVCLVALKTL